MLVTYLHLSQICNMEYDDGFFVAHNAMGDRAGMLSNIRFHDAGA